MVVMTVCKEDKLYTIIFEPCFNLVAVILRACVDKHIPASAADNVTVLIAAGYHINALKVHFFPPLHRTSLYYTNIGASKMMYKIFFF